MKSVLSFIILITLLQQNLLFSQWEMINSPNATPDVRNVVSHPDGYLLTITAQYEVFRSDTNKTNWQKISTVSDEIKCLVVTPQGTIYAGITEGYLQSVDDGITWTKKELFSNVSHVSDIEVFDNGKIFMVQSCQYYPEYNWVWISSTNGSLWARFNHGLNGEELLKLTKDSNENLYLLTRTGTIYKSTDQAYSWQMMSQLYLTSFDLECDSSNNLYAATSNYIYISRDLGVTWNIIYFGWTYNITIGCNNLIYAHDFNDIIYTSSGGMSVWDSLELTGTAIYDIIEVENTIFVATGTSSVSTYLNAKGLQRSTDSGANWDVCFRYTDKFIKINDIVLFDEKIVVAGKDGLYLSPDNGVSWDTVLIGNMNLIKLDGLGNLYSTSRIESSPSGAFYRSVDGGATWEQSIIGINTFSVTDSNHIFAAKSVRVLKSRDYGTSWDTINNLSNFPVTNELTGVLQIPDGKIFVSTYWRFYVPGIGPVDYTYLIRSSNNGEDWDILNDLYVSNIYFFDSTLYLTTFNEGIYKSNNDGIDVIPLNNGLTSMNVKELIVTPNRDLICLTGNGIYSSLDLGNSWGRLDHTGLLSADITSIFYYNGSLFAGTNNGIGKFLGNLVSINDNNKELIPASYSISQNYPNPFNPTTKISYTLPNSGNVQLKIYNVLGKEIQTLINEFKSAGEYEISFAAGNLPSGVYFYRIQCESFSETKKMILLK